MSDYHEPSTELDAATRDLHRALSSLKEEVEAVDWYHQRAVCAEDPELRRVIEHNRDEEIEHACMVLEWLRRTQPAWEQKLRQYLFTTRPLGRASEEPGRSEGNRPAGTPAPGTGLGVGSLKAGRP